MTRYLPLGDILCFIRKSLCFLSFTWKKHGFGSMLVTPEYTMTDQLCISLQGFVRGNMMKAIDLEGNGETLL